MRIKLTISLNLTTEGQVLSANVLDIRVLEADAELQPINRSENLLMQYSSLALPLAEDTDDDSN